MLGQVGRSMEIASILVEIMRMCCAVGMIVAVVTIFSGMDLIDEDASGTYSFRVLLIPGVITLWSVVCIRWIVLERARRDAST